MVQGNPSMIPTLAQQRPTQTTKYRLDDSTWAQYGADAAPTSKAHNVGKNDANGARLNPDFLQIKNWVCTCSMPAPPTPPPLGQSYINSLRCSQVRRLCFVLAFFLKCLAWAKIQRHWNAQVQDKSQHRPQNSRGRPNMSPIWRQRGPKCPKIWPTQTTNSPKWVNIACNVPK